MKIIGNIEAAIHHYQFYSNTYKAIKFLFQCPSGYGKISKGKEEEKEKENDAGKLIKCLFASMYFFL